jgi:hypothetical protein
MLGTISYGPWENRKIDPGKVFDLTLPLDQVRGRANRATDERRAIKTLLWS